MRVFVSFHLVVILGIAFCSSPTHGGEEGPCRFIGDYCTCKLGEANQGVCWDRVSGIPSAASCESRFCRAGWVCSCPGRTHVCDLRERTINVVDERLGANTATCHEETAFKPAPPFLRLGSWAPSLSRKGMVANACREIAWWHNGVLMGVYEKEPEISTANLEAQMDRRTNHVLLELQRGDILAFRFKNGSYHCYNHISNINIDGVELTTEDPSIETLYSRGHSANWFMPNFVPNTKEDLADAAITDFTALRTTMATGEADVPGEDNWKRADGSEDHKVSNFYFRIRL